jgi:hypothetical protein
LGFEWDAVLIHLNHTSLEVRGSKFEVCKCLETLTVLCTSIRKNNGFERLKWSYFLVFTTYSSGVILIQENYDNVYLKWV